MSFVKHGILVMLLAFAFKVEAQSLRDSSLQNPAVYPDYTLHTVSKTSTKKTGDKEVQSQDGLELYGFIMTNVIYDFKQMDPNWYDAPRPTKLPAHQDQFAPNGQIYFSMRQTRVGVRGSQSTSLGDLKTWFEFDFFGSGADAGQTTLHLRHAYGELGKFGAGQTWSTFMDPDVIPNSMEYWGPNGMVFSRNVQLRFMPVQGNTRFSIAIERPGASADEGIYADRIELKNVKPQFTLPDLTSQYRYGTSWGYIALAGILRQLKWKDLDTSGTDLSGKKTGWGLSLSSGIHLLAKDKLHLQMVYGEGIENYFRDAPADVSVETKDVNTVEGVALPVLGIVAFYDHYWNKKFTSTIGYSSVDVTNSNGQAGSAFKTGHYGLADLIYYPVDHVLIGVEFHYLKRVNFKDGWNVTDPRVQFSFRYNFSQKFFQPKDSG